MRDARRAMRIRQARTADSDAIAAIYVDTWRDAYAGVLPDRVLVNMSRRRQAADWRHALSHQSGGHHILVAEAGEAGEVAIAGFGSCGPARDTGLAYLGEVFTLYVDPVHQGQGIGKALLAALFQALIRQGMASAVIWVLADNPARFFYEAHGGRLVGTRDERLWGTDLREIAYGWDDLAAPTAGRTGKRLPYER